MFLFSLPKYIQKYKPIGNNNIPYGTSNLKEGEKNARERNKEKLKIKSKEIINRLLFLK